LSEAGASKFIEPISNLILATKKHVTTDKDGAVSLDIDLSILGQSEERFSEYEKQIRLEYEWVPEEIFRSKRCEILQNFLNRERLFTTDLFFSKYERQARLNLDRSLSTLRS
jgi:predicted metal-dependent HD superfamily phosphohydrolase